MQLKCLLYFRFYSTLTVNLIPSSIKTKGESCSSCIVIEVFIEEGDENVITVTSAKGGSDEIRLCWQRSKCLLALQTTIDYP